MEKGNKIVINILGCMFIAAGIWLFFTNLEYGVIASPLFSAIILTIGLIIVTTLNLLE
jgi:hypothetical protein